ncbi:Carbohydrate-binding protein [Phytophthora cinnamomi]|uniref:Carbohydrate-binding protein n=1 Tax=Phytophthora cinnamomi TaxID=4785 RepID=UPI00355AAAB5|nr:Carbohydrate-binding protein [Phytophthora cinnamomi]
MKLFTLVSAIITINACKVATQTLDNSTSMANNCDQPCDTFDEYCEISTGMCRGPNYVGECFNPATGAFQDGCDSGFECIDNKCDYQETETTASNSASGCTGGTQCSVFGQYCDSTVSECRAPNDGECYNAVSAVFQDGCAEGYECLDGMCQVIATATDNSVCYLVCSSGEYCENGTDECRAPNYDGECFNPATGYYQNGCDPGFSCSNNQCSYA